MSYGEVPFGMREIVIRDENNANQVDFPVSILMAISERIEAVEYMAEGKLVAMESHVVACDWELEAGGISLAAWARLTGRTADEVGTTPNRTRSTSILRDVFPYVQILGRSVGDASDDIYIRLFRAKVTRIEGTLRQREFYISSCAGVAVPRAVDGYIYTIVQRETALAF